MQAAVLYESLKSNNNNNNNSVRCTACNHYCTIADGERGICGVRKNLNGTLFSEAYGQPVAFQLDPIEKKPLFHFFPGSTVASIGTKGCNFSCAFCQNSSLSMGRYNDGQYENQKSAQIISPKNIIETVMIKDCPSIAFTYNEPGTAPEYVHDIARKAKETKTPRDKNINTVLVSNGFESKECLEYWDGLIDAANIDLKSFNNDFYKNICGGSLAPVLKTIETLLKQNVWVEITTLLIPGLNDSDQEIKSIASYIRSLSVDIPWHITAFHPAHKMDDRPSTTEKTIRKAIETAKKLGLNYVYGGNISAHDLMHTRCPSCGDIHIKRGGNHTTCTSETLGICGNCKQGIPGRFFNGTE